jgi:hypothetical protein
LGLEVIRAGLATRAAALIVDPSLVSVVGSSHHEVFRLTPSNVPGEGTNIIHLVYP